MKVTRVGEENGFTVYDPPIATDYTTDLRGDALNYARLQWQAGFTSLESGLDVNVVICDYHRHEEGDQRYHITINGAPVGVGHFAHSATWHRIVGIAIGARAARERS